MLDEVQLPIDMQSKNTMVNVAKNKAAIDYCELPRPRARRRGCPASALLQPVHDTSLVRLRDVRLPGQQDQMHRIADR
jgi:hypothetical protein